MTAAVYPATVIANHRYARAAAAFKAERGQCQLENLMDAYELLRLAETGDPARAAHDACDFVLRIIDNERRRLGMESGARGHRDG